MRGDKVIVRSFGGRALVRRVWCVQDGAVYICSERNFNALTNGARGSSCTGFPADDVFQYEEACASVDRSIPAPEFWDKLTLYITVAGSAVVTDCAVGAQKASE